MATEESEATLTAAKIKADANFKKEQRAAEGAKAMLEYQASGREAREQMARLRALRLAKEAETAAKPAPVQAPAKTGVKTKAKKVAAAE